MKAKKKVILVAVAMAPFASISCPAQADPPPWAPAHGFRAKQAGNKGKADTGRDAAKERAPDAEAKEDNGPPSWAPAHGYRAKQAQGERVGGQGLKDHAANDPAAEKERGGPPPWAPAHGYRARQAQGEPADGKTGPGARAGVVKEKEGRGGPPPWAPAWGYRGQHPHGKVKKDKATKDRED